MTWQDVGIILAVLAATAGVLYVLQRYVPHPLREVHNDVAGFIFAAVGVLYAVLLAFVVIAVWENADGARKTTFQEADSLAGVYWISRELPAPMGPQLEKNTIAYANLVKDTEWPMMAKHQSSSDATQLVYQMRQDVFAMQPVTDQQKVLYDHAVTHLESLASERRERLNLIDEEVPPLLWIALIGGAILTVGFTFLFGLSNAHSHAIMVLILTGLVVVSLVVIREMDFPFAGVTAIKPTAFEVFLNRLPTPR